MHSTTRGTVTSTMRRAAHPFGCARCGAGAGCSVIVYKSLCGGQVTFDETVVVHRVDYVTPEDGLISLQ